MYVHVYGEAKYPYDCFVVSKHSVIMADFLMMETQQLIIVIVQLYAQACVLLHATPIN